MFNLSSKQERNRPSLDPAELSFFETIQGLIDTSPKIAFPKSIRKICGVDAVYSSSSNKVRTVASLLGAGDGKVLETYTYQGRFTFPYVPGIFYIHEGPFVIAAVRGLQEKPDLVCFDGHGKSHPRGAGLATICGKILEIPSIGLAKSRLVGEAAPYKEGVEKMKYEGSDVGFLTLHEGRKKYWSQGYAVTMGELEEIISSYANVCVKAIAEADKIGKSEPLD